jgi:hypothetical protein
MPQQVALRPLSYEYLEEIAASLKMPPEGVEALLFAPRLLWELRSSQEGSSQEAGGPEASPLDPTAEERWQMWRTAIAAGWTVAETLFAELARRKRRRRWRGRWPKRRSTHPSGAGG